MGTVVIVSKQMRYFHTPLPERMGFEKHVGSLHHVSQQTPLFSQLNCLQSPCVVRDTSRSSSSRQLSVAVTNSQEKQLRRKKDLFRCTVSDLSVCSHMATWRGSCGKTESMSPRPSSSANMFSISYLVGKQREGSGPNATSKGVLPVTSLLPSKTYLLKVAPCPQSKAARSLWGTHFGSNPQSSHRIFTGYLWVIFLCYYPGAWLLGKECIKMYSRFGWEFPGSFMQSPNYVTILTLWAYPHQHLVFSSFLMTSFNSIRIKR